MTSPSGLPFYARVLGSTSVLVYVVAFVPGEMGPVAIYQTKQGTFSYTNIGNLIVDAAEGPEPVTADKDRAKVEA